MMRSLVQLAFVLAIAWTSSFGQVPDEKAFSSVPVPQRPRLIARLNLYIDLLMKNNQSALTEMYDEETLCSLCMGKCLEDCAPPMRLEVPKGFRSVILAFVPVRVSPYEYDGIGDYSIEVEQTERLSWKGKPPHVVKNKVKVFAVYQRGDWYFSPVSIPGMIYL